MLANVYLPKPIETLRPLTLQEGKQLQRDTSISLRSPGDEGIAAITVLRVYVARLSAGSSFISTPGTVDTDDRRRQVDTSPCDCVTAPNRTTDGRTARRLVSWHAVVRWSGARWSGARWSGTRWSCGPGVWWSMRSVKINNVRQNDFGRCGKHQ